MTHATESGLPAGTRSVSVFLVNRRPPKPDDLRDEAFAFQAQLDIHGDRPFVPRPDLRSLESHDWDERVADLQYRDTCECAVGHNIATEAILNDAARVLDGPHLLDSARRGGTGRPGTDSGGRAVHGRPGPARRCRRCARAVGGLGDPVSRLDHHPAARHTRYAGQTS